MQKLNIVTVVLDGEPYIERHLPTFEKTNLDWHWHVAEGAAMNVNCTRWCKKQRPRLSRDGTTEYLNSIVDHPRVTLHRRQKWNGKLEMFNTLLEDIEEPCILMEIDADEIWTAAQLEQIVELFGTHPEYDHMKFYCNFYVGENIVIKSRERYGNRPNEWIRAWTFFPGMMFLSHEPPRFWTQSSVIDKNVTELYDLVFDHYAYATEAQVWFKEAFYGYKGAVKGWHRLRANTRWPVKNLKDFLPFVDEGVEANIIPSPVAVAR